MLCPLSFHSFHPQNNGFMLIVGRQRSTLDEQHYDVHARPVRQPQSKHAQVAQHVWDPATYGVQEQQHRQHEAAPYTDVLPHRATDVEPRHLQLQAGSHTRQTDVDAASLARRKSSHRSLQPMTSQSQRQLVNAGGARGQGEWLHSATKITQTSRCVQLWMIVLTVAVIGIIGGLIAVGLSASQPAGTSASTAASMDDIQKVQDALEVIRQELREQANVLVLLQANASMHANTARVEQLADQLNNQTAELEAVSEKFDGMHIDTLQQASAEHAATLSVLRLSNGFLVDNDGHVGSHSSLALTSGGLPVMAYLDNTNRVLKLAVCADASCSTSTIRTVDSNSGVGQYTSVALTSEDIPVVSYFDDNLGDLKLVICNDLTCSDPTLVTVDEDEWVGLDTSLAITSNNHPVIAYYDTFGDTSLNLAVCGSVSCSSPTLRSIASPGGLYPSLALTLTNIPFISFHDDANGHLKLIECSDISCTTSTVYTVDSSDSVGLYTSLALTATGIPVISYFDSANSDLLLAVCDSATSCSSPMIRTLDDNNVGQFTSLAVSSNGRLIISYWDGFNGDLKLAVCGDSTCSRLAIRVLDSVDDVGQYSSLALTSKGDAVISYLDSTNSALKLIGVLVA
eukprot:m.29495 g.29495  ORF g.29495 m.29495 type:complete len:626 (-) comp9171_c0_seq2:57-1934(-)